MPQQPATQSPLRQTPTAQAPMPPKRVMPAAAAPQRVERVESSSDMRVTQIATSSSSAPVSQPVSHRSQSLFQRITGFGMVRPSAVRDAEEALRDVEEAASEPRLSVDPADRPAISGEQQDLLDIPAFLRRQTNH
jgi:cell division protein FtsZ